MGKSQQVQPQVTGTIPEEFLPFAQSLVSYITGRQAQPYPNPYQQGLLGSFFGNVPQAVAPPTTPGVPGFQKPPGYPIGGTAPATGASLLDFLRGGGGEGIPGGGVPIGPDGRPLFGPQGSGATFGGTRANTGLMALLNRVFPGYSQRAMGQGQGQPGTPMAGSWEAIGGRDAPWGGAGGTVGGLMELRAESAARNLRIDSLMDELARQRAEQGLPPL